MENMDVTAQKILHLKELVEKQDRNEGSALRLFHELFQLTHEGRDLTTEDAEWLNQTACLFLSPELLKVLFKHRLEIHGFQFAALNFIDINDVIDDLSNEEVLKNRFPPGSYNKLKRDLLSKSFETTQRKMERASYSNELETEKIHKEEVVEKKPEDNPLYNLLLKNFLSGNKERVSESLKDFVNDKQFSIKAIEVKNLVRQSAKLLLSTEVTELLENNLLGEYSYLLAVNHVLELEDLKEDLANGDIIQRALPQGAFNTLKRQLVTQTSFDTNCEDKFQKLSLISGVNDIETTIVDDLENVDVLNNIKSLPSGAYNNLTKRDVAVLQNNLDGQSTMNRQIEREVSNLNLSSAVNENASKNTTLPSTPPTTPKPQRLAEKLRNRCSFIDENISGMKLYQLPLTTEDQNLSSKTNRRVFGERSKTNVECRTILLVGATGSGKTTLINAMVNYILGVEWGDPFRFMLINEEDTSSLPDNKSQAHSQTSKVTAYELHHQEGFRVPFSLIIVDTPGYGDTKGIDRDFQITDAIQQFFKDENGIQVLDAVGFTVQAALARLTASQTYIFESILAIFGNDVRDNISFLVTFTDGQTPPVLDAIKEANITHHLDAHGKPYHHRFNNSGFFASNQKDGDDDDFGPMFWKLGMKNFASFFSELSLMKTRSLTLTNEVLQERKRINVTIDGLTQNVQKQLTKMDELRKTKQVFENHSDQIDANKNFKYDVTVSIGDKIEINDGKFTTNCAKCSRTCHFPCAYANDSDKQKCSAMGADGLCGSCPMKCKWDEHTNQRYHWVFKDVIQTRTYDDIKKKYEEAFQKKLSTEGVLQALGSELDQIKFDLKRDIEKITICLRRLDQIALRPDAFTSTDYIELMIQSEMKEKKLGFQERIDSLNSLLGKARVVRKIIAGESFIPEAEGAAGQSGSSQVMVVMKVHEVEKKPTMGSQIRDKYHQYKPW